MLIKSPVLLKLRVNPKTRFLRKGNEKENDRYTDTRSDSSQFCLAASYTALPGWIFRVGNRITAV